MSSGHALVWQKAGSCVVIKAAHAGKVAALSGVAAAGCRSLVLLILQQPQSTVASHFSFFTACRNDFSETSRPTLCVCVCVPSPASTPHHLALVEQGHLNVRQAAVFGYRQLVAKDNSRHNSVHTEERSWVIIHSGLEARNKCPCVIDYTLQANEINRAWIDSVESCQRGIRSRVQWLHWHAHIRRASERDQAALLAENRAASSSAARSRFAHHCNQGQRRSNRTLAMGSDKPGTCCLTISTKKKILSPVEGKQHSGCASRTTRQTPELRQFGFSWRNSKLAMWSGLSAEAAAATTASTKSPAPEV